MTCTVMEMHFVFDFQVQDYIIGLMGVRQSFVEMVARKRMIKAFTGTFFKCWDVGFV